LMQCRMMDFLKLNNLPQVSPVQGYDGTGPATNSETTVSLSFVPLRPYRPPTSLASLRDWSYEPTVDPHIRLAGTAYIAGFLEQLMHGLAAHAATGPLKPGIFFASLPRAACLPNG
ncbi:hypothetical protein G3M48_002354, partial [Beauveria asiatica]